MAAMVMWLILPTCVAAKADGIGAFAIVLYSSGTGRSCGGPVCCIVTSENRISGRSHEHFLPIILSAAALCILFCRIGFGCLMPAHQAAIHVDQRISSDEPGAQPMPRNVTILLCGQGENRGDRDRRLWSRTKIVSADVVKTGFGHVA